MLALGLLAVSLAGGGLQPAEAGSPVFRAPLNTRADPDMTFYKGNYYLAETDFQDIYMRVSPTIGGLLGADRRLVWHPTDPAANRNVWAPSFMILNDRWYLYYTADNGVDDNHRNYVVESTGAVSAGALPTGPYAYKARVFDATNDSWAIDGLPVRINGNLYFGYSGLRAETFNALMIAPMSNPWTISGARTYLPASGGCPEVREAPSFLQRNGRTFMVYSTCDTGKPDYQLWMTSIADGQNPLVASNWFQHTSAVFTRNDAAGVYGPGSNSFFKSPDGREDWLVYHAKNTTSFTYDSRTTRAQKITWNADGTPNLGRPVAAGASQTVPSGDPATGPTAINDFTTGALATGAIGAPGGKCVDVDGNLNANGRAIQLWPCNGVPGQTWTVAGDGTLRAFGRCLEIAGNVVTNGARTQLWDCNGSGGQVWVPQANGALRNTQSGRCLDVPNGDTTDGRDLRLWDCNGAGAQAFRLPAATMRVSYGGAWSSGSGCGVQCYFSDDHWSNSVNATATVSFTGTRIALLSAKDIGNGIAAISIDGAPEVQVDLYASIRQGEDLQYLSPRLFNGSHTMRIRVTGQRNAASNNTFIGIDRLEIYS